MKQSSSFFFLARPSRFTVSLAAAALIGGVCFGARAMARQTPTSVTPASGVPVPPAPKPADPPTRPVGTAPTDAAKPPLVLRGVTSDGAGDLGFGERGHTTPDLGDDRVWDSWRLEGPSFVWFFRGTPHVHVWVNIASDAGVKLNA